MKTSNERELGLDGVDIFHRFRQRISANRVELGEFIRSAVRSGKKVGAEKLEDQLAENYGFGIMPRLVFGFSVIGVLIIGGGGWAMTADLSGAIIAQGSVVVKRNVKKVQHRDGGIVSKINVRNGDKVNPGDVLITLDDTQLKANLSIIQSRLVELTGRSARLIAERDGMEFIEFSEQFLEMGPMALRVAHGERRLFRVNKQTRESQKNQLNLRIGQINSEIEGFWAQQKAKTTELELMQKELRSVRQLYKRKLTPLSRVYSMEREAARLKGGQGSLTSQVARAEGQINEIRVQILSIEQSIRSDAQKQLRDIEAKVTELRERKIAAEDQLNRVDLRSSIAGFVHELAVHTIGGVITPAEPVMLIVPEGDDLMIEARIAPRDIDQIWPGQIVRLRFSAFSQRKTPELNGRVVKVSADVSQDPSTGQRYYVGSISIDDDISQKLGELKILPGMPVEVFITTGARTALSFLVKPFVDQLARTFREE